MANKGFIGLDELGRMMVDHYSHVLWFKSAEDARIAGAITVKALERARITPKMRNATKIAEVKATK